MDAQTIVKMNEGDIFRWSYREGSKHGSYTYHCCSNIAVFKNGRLRDTYWHGYATSSDGRSWSPEECGPLELRPVANETDLEPAGSYLADYYDDADIVDLRHANGGAFYLRKGATRSTTKMLLTAKERLKRSDEAISSAEFRSACLRATIAKIEAGETEICI